MVVGLEFFTIPVEQQSAVRTEISRLIDSI